jgi:hypothetical protein
LAELIAGGGAIPNCLHTDYDSLKDQITTLTSEKQTLQSERDNALKEKDTALNEKESQIKSILQNLNTSLDLNLQEPTLEEVITKIKALLKDPKVVVEEIMDNSQIENLQTTNQQLQQTIASLEAQLAQRAEENKENATTAIPVAANEEVSKENKEAILQVLKESNETFSSPIYQEEIEQIQQAQSAKQLAKSYQQVIDKGLTKLQTIKTEKTELVQHQKTERIV